jgi:hypothetical protein
VYRPLPEHLEIRESGIHGHGLFADVRIPPGTELGVTHVEDERFPDGWIRTPLGGFYNHSNLPNCELVGDLTSSPERKVLKTIRPVQAGQEITCRYTIWDIGEINGTLELLR